MKQILEKYLAAFPNEQDRLRQFTEFLRLTLGGPSLFDRKNFNGHLTASAFVLSPDRTRLAMVNHKLLHRHLQPGGHIDPTDATILAAAHREVEEETNLLGCQYIPFHPDPTIPLDIDTHPIPVNPKKSEPAHFHHDIRYLFLSPTEGDGPGDCEWQWLKIEDALHGENFSSVRPKIIRVHDRNGLRSYCILPP